MSLKLTHYLNKETGLYDRRAWVKRAPQWFVLAIMAWQMRNAPKPELME